MDSLESWVAFRDGERINFLSRHEVCCLCNGPAEGNAQFVDGEEICDNCVEHDLTTP